MIDFIIDLTAGTLCIIFLLILLACALYPLLPELPEEKDD